MPLRLLTSTQKERSATELVNLQAGFSIAEAIVSIFIVSLLAAALVGTLGYGFQAASIAGARSRANFLAEEGLEATRNIRDASFSNLVDGTYGLAINTNQWTFSGSSDITDNIFTRQITISDVNSVTKQVISTVTWNQNSQLNGKVSLVTYMGNVGLLSLQSNFLSINKSAGNIATNKLQGITLQNVGSNAVVITKIAATWTPSTNKIQEIDIGSTKVWTSTGIGTPTGTQPSGTTLSISSYTLASGSAAQSTTFIFSGSMTGNSFTITFTMSDGSTKIVTYP